MRVIGYILAILAASILLAVLRVALVAIVAVYLLTLIVCAAVRPKETFGLLTYLLACFMIDNHTAATLGTIVTFVIAGAVVKATHHSK